MKICFPVAENKGLESPVYNHFGSAPMFLLVDPSGNVVNNNVQAAELEDALKQLLDDRAAGRPSERR